MKNETKAGLATVKSKQFSDAGASKNLTAEHIRTISCALFVSAREALELINNPHAAEHKEFWSEEFKKCEAAYHALNGHNMGLVTSAINDAKDRGAIAPLPASVPVTDFADRRQDLNYKDTMKTTALVLILALTASQAMADGKAVTECQADITQKIRANEALAKAHSTTWLTEQHHRLFDQRASCKNLLNASAAEIAKAKQEREMQASR